MSQTPLLKLYSKGSKLTLICLTHLIKILQKGINNILVTILISNAFYQALPQVFKSAFDPDLELQSVIP